MLLFIGAGEIGSKFTYFLVLRFPIEICDTIVSIKLKIQEIRGTEYCCNIRITES